MKAFSSIGRLFKYYELFGADGVRFLLKKTLTKNKVISVTPKGFEHALYIRNNTSDGEAFWQIFERHDYELDYGNSVKTIIDCGANIGFASVYYKNKFPDATIIAVEPEPSNYAMLVKNTEKYNNIHCLNYGIWNRSTNLEITNEGNGNWSFSTKEVDYENENTIRAISIQEILQTYKLDKIDILKIDIEGSESDLFSTNFEKWLPLTKTLVIELHDWMRPNCSKHVFRAMGNYDFKAFFKGENLVCILENN